MVALRAISNGGLPDDDLKGREVGAVAPADAGRHACAPAKQIATEAVVLQSSGLSLGDPDHRGDAAIHVGIGGGPAGNADAHGGPALPDGNAAPASAVFLKLFDHAFGFLGVAEGDEDLVEDDVV